MKADSGQRNYHRFEEILIDCKAHNQVGKAGGEKWKSLTEDNIRSYNVVNGNLLFQLFKLYQQLEDQITEYHSTRKHCSVDRVFYWELTQGFHRRKINVHSKPQLWRHRLGKPDLLSAPTQTLLQFGSISILLFVFLDRRGLNIYCAIMYLLSCGSYGSCFSSSNGVMVFA